MPSHARSFSNDRANLAPLEPRRHRRAAASIGGSVSANASASGSGSGSGTDNSRLSIGDKGWPPTTPQSDRFDLDDQDEESQRPLTPIMEKPRNRGPPGAQGVTWMSLPRKDQLLILFIGRLVDFLQVASMQAYVFYQLKSFDPELSDAQVSQQAGLLQGCFTGAQVLTAILWGKAADARWCGRKWVLVIGLGGTAFSCIGYGFATTFFWAAFWRAFGGAINGTVGIIRTMVAEITVEKKYQSRAFLILPMSFNVAGILGPIMGGMLANPSMTLPGLFGEQAIFGFQWLRDYPFALPSLVNCFTLSFATACTFLFLEETSKVRQGKYDPGLHLAVRLKKWLRPGHSHEGYTQISASWEDTAVQLETFNDKSPNVHVTPISTRVLPFWRLWTRNVIFTLLTGALYDFHLGAFTNIWSLFLSTPRYTNEVIEPAITEPPAPQRRDLPMLFTGGLGMPASTVGVATSFLGIIGMALQIFLYPPIQARLGTIRSFRWFLPLFPVAYFIAPYLSIVPSSTAPPDPAAGFSIWTGILFVLLLQVTARTFTLPASIILLNNCSPHPSVLGTIHGLGQSVSAGFRTVGPVVGGWWYGYGLDIGMVAWGWWGVAIMSTVACVSALGMHEGSGHEIYLDGEMEEE